MNSIRAQKKNSYQKNTMNYEEIKRIREEFHLERHEVYTLNSEFDSMLYMQDNQSKGHSKDAKSDKKEPEIEMNSFIENKGITCEFFFEHTTFMKGILPDIKKRIVTALGLDADSPHTTLNWENYVALY